MSNGTDESYWSRTRGLMWLMLVVLAIFAFIVHFFANSLNQIVIFGTPLGFYMAAQGSLIVFVAMLFFFARRQDTVDREEGLSEDV